MHDVCECAGVRWRRFQCVSSKRALNERAGGENHENKLQKSDRFGFKGAIRAPRLFFAVRPRRDMARACTRSQRTLLTANGQNPSAAMDRVCFVRRNYRVLPRRPASRIRNRIMQRCRERTAVGMLCLHANRPRCRGTCHHACGHRHEPLRVHRRTLSGPPLAPARDVSRRIPSHDLTHPFLSHGGLFPSHSVATAVCAALRLVA